MQLWIAQLISSETPVTVFTAARSFNTVLLASDEMGIAFNVNDRAIVVPWTSVQYISERAS